MSLVCSPRLRGGCAPAAIGLARKRHRLVIGRRSTVVGVRARPTGATMRFHILGPLQVHSEDGRAIRLDPRQSRIVAALLLAANRPLARPHLIDAVWADSPPTTAT